MTRSITAGALSLIAAGIVGGGFALAMNQDAPKQPMHVRQVVATSPATSSATPTTKTPKPATTTKRARPAAKPSKARSPKPVARIQQIAPEPQPTATTPEPAPQGPAPIKPGPGTLVTATCGGASCSTTGG